MDEIEIACFFALSRAEHFPELYTLTSPWHCEDYAKCQLQGREDISSSSTWKAKMSLINGSKQSMSRTGVLHEPSSRRRTPQKVMFSVITTPLLPDVTAAAAALPRATLPC